MAQPSTRKEAVVGSPVEGRWPHAKVPRHPQHADGRARGASRGGGHKRLHLLRPAPPRDAGPAARWAWREPDDERRKDGAEGGSRGGDAPRDHPPEHHASPAERERDRERYRDRERRLFPVDARSSLGLLFALFTGVRGRVILGSSRQGSLGGIILSANAATQRKERSRRRTKA